MPSQVVPGPGGWYNSDSAATVHLKSRGRCMCYLSCRGLAQSPSGLPRASCVCMCGGVSFPPTFAQKPVLSVSFTGRQEEAPQQGSPLHPRRGLWVSLMPTVPLASSVSALRRVRLAVGPPHADRLGPRERAAWTVQPLPTSAPQLDELPSGPAWAPGGQGGL